MKLELISLAERAHFMQRGNNMQFQVIHSKLNMAGNEKGRKLKHVPAGSLIELDVDAAKNLVGRGFIKPYEKPDEVKIEKHEEDGVKPPAKKK